MATQAVLYVQDLEALAAFYEGCVGLTLAETGDGYCELRSDGLVLWLVRGQQAPGVETDRDEAVRRRSKVPVKLAFEVESIERAAGSIEHAGSMAEASWNFGGYRRRDAVDPEGNIFQLIEPLS